jgi:hypothetical protein
MLGPLMCLLFQCLVTDEGKQCINDKILEGGKQKRSEIKPVTGSICVPQIRKNGNRDSASRSYYTARC